MKVRFPQKVTAALLCALLTVTLFPAPALAALQAAPLPDTLEAGEASPGNAAPEPSESSEDSPYVLSESGETTSISWITEPDGKTYLIDPDVDINEDQADHNFETFADGEIQACTFDQFEYRQTEARSMLPLVNNFRASNAWYWNQANTTKLTAGVLSPLSFDGELEKMAMQRAAEIAVRFSHTRPNGKPYSSVSSDLGLSVSSAGENIAAGYSTAQATFDQWAEEDEPYSGQGHRRNMLDIGASRRTAIGIACVKYAGVNYWTMEFGTHTPINTPGAAADGSSTVNIEILKDRIESQQFRVNPDSVTVTAGETTSLPGAFMHTKIKADASGPDKEWGWFTDQFGKTNSPVWSSSNSSIAQIQGSNVKGVKAGSAALAVKDYGQTLTVPVTVKGNMAQLNASLSYTSAQWRPWLQSPDITVKDGTKTLSYSTDYLYIHQGPNGVSSYLVPGTHSFIVSGRGSYGGSIALNYTITAASVNDADFRLSGDTFSYTGSDIEPTVYGTMRKDSASSWSLQQNRDFKVTYSSNRAIGTAKVTITGIGSMTGSKTLTFKIIDPNDLTDIGTDHFTVYPPSDCIWTGSDLKPEPSLWGPGNKWLEEGTDYTATYLNNRNVGTATIQLKGIGGYTGTRNVTFKITPAPLSCSGYSYGTPTYTGKPVDPQIQFHFRNGKLVQDRDYTVKLSNNVNAGTGKATVTGMGNYTGSFNASFTIDKRNINSVTAAAIPNQMVTGKQLTPKPVLTFNGKRLVENVDYTLSYGANRAVGTGAVNVYGKGNFGASRTLYFNIAAASVPNQGASTKPSTGSAAAAAKVPMHRVFNKVTGEHFYTASDSELKSLTTGANARYWKYEGDHWSVPKTSSKPVYRLCNPLTGDHHYTMDRNEYLHVRNVLKWRDEGIGWYSEEPSKGTRLMRLNNPRLPSGAHHFVINPAERDQCKRQGWIDEGYAWYVCK